MGRKRSRGTPQEFIWLFSAVSYAEDVWRLPAAARRAAAGHGGALQPAGPNAELSQLGHVPPPEGPASLQQGAGMRPPVMSSTPWSAGELPQSAFPGRYRKAGRDISGHTHKGERADLAASAGTPVTSRAPPVLGVSPFQGHVPPSLFLHSDHVPDAAVAGVPASL